MSDGGLAELLVLAQVLLNRVAFLLRQFSLIRFGKMNAGSRRVTTSHDKPEENPCGNDGDTQ